jgi:hypothetical protein
MGPLIAIPQSPHLRNVRKSDKLLKPANLRFCDSRNLFGDRPPLGTEQVVFTLPTVFGLAGLVE